MGGEMSAEIGTSILVEAEELINGRRRQDYGDAKENFDLVDRLWSEVLGSKVKAHQVALCMIQLKISRVMRTPGRRDSWVDIARYAGLADKILEEWQQ